MFFRTAVLRKLFDIRFSYKHCNFSRVCQGPLLNLDEINLSWKQHGVEYWLGLGKEHLDILKTLELLKFKTRLSIFCW